MGLYSNLHEPKFKGTDWLFSQCVIGDVISGETVEDRWSRDVEASNYSIGP